MRRFTHVFETTLPQLPQEKREEWAEMACAATALSIAAALAATDGSTRDVLQRTLDEIVKG